MIEDFFLGAVSGGGVLFVLWKLVPRALRAFGVYLPKSMNEYRMELERLVIAVVQSDADAAMHKAALMEYIGQMPSDFDPTAFLALNVAQAVHREVMLEYERRGIVTEGMTERIFGAERDPLPPRAYMAEDDAPRPRRLGGKLLPLRRVAER